MGRIGATGAGLKRALIIGSAAAALLLAGCAGPKPDRGSVRPQGTLAEAVTTPLADVNLKRVRIPDVLRRAVANPYDPHGTGQCRTIAAEVAQLDDALGPDADEPPAPDTREGLARTAGQAHSVAVVAVREGVSSAVPFRGWVRQISGAARRQKAVQDAGSIRRGYLKGVGMRLNCAPPAAPSWFKPVVGAAARPAAAPVRRAPAPAPPRRTR